MPTRAARRTSLTQSVRSPVLLVGAGTGEATCGILYLASYLRRHGIEAYVRLTDDDESDAAVARSLEQLVAYVRPQLVGISLKWFHHVARAQLIAKTLKALDPSLPVALGGNTATYFWKELMEWDCVDHVVLGDGEVPLLALCRQVKDAPNVITRDADGGSKRAPLGYVQGTASSDVYYSHFDELFLSELDLASFSGWVAPGKGCGENCLYCGGTRGMQKATFGRAVPFLRPEACVQRDHREIASKTWQLRYDFAGSTPTFLERCWEGVDLSRHSTTYFLWGVPPDGLMHTLSKTFERVFMVLDIGCFSQLQRNEQLSRGLLKPCPSDAELMKVIDAARRYPNLQLEVSGIAGLPFASTATLKEERALVKQVLGLGCMVGYQRLEAQPGALVTEHPERFEMRSEARTFAEFLDYFERLEPGAGTVPMLRYRDASLEAAVQRTSDEVDAMVWAYAAKKRAVTIDGRTRLRNAAAATREVELGSWLGRHKVPARLAKEPLTIVRSVDGAGLACAPTLSPQRFSDPALQQGDDASALLAVLSSFEKPTTVDVAMSRLRKGARVDGANAREMIDHLVDGRFLQPA